MLAYSFAVVIAIIAAPVFGQDASATPKVVADIARCRTIAEPDRRLACFDASAKALEEAADARSIVVLDREEVKRTRRSLFGFALPRLPFLGGGEKDAPDDKEVVRQIETTVVRATPSGYGRWTLTLAEGGTWQTTETDRAFAPSAGDRIVIKRGPLGGYLATGITRRPMRVARVG